MFVVRMAMKLFIFRLQKKQYGRSGDHGVPKWIIRPLKAAMICQREYGLDGLVHFAIPDA